MSRFWPILVRVGLYAGVKGILGSSPCIVGTCEIRYKSADNMYLLLLDTEYG